MYKIILAFRYLFRKRISYLALGAVALCVFIVVVVMTVMSGLVNDFKRKNHDFVGDCVAGTDSLVGFAYYEDFMAILEQSDLIEAVSPVINSYAMINPIGSERNISIDLMGIDAARHSLVTGFGKSLYHNKSNPSRAFMPAYDPNLLGCVVGIDRWLSRDSRGKYPNEPVPFRAKLAISSFPLTARGTLAKAGAAEINTKTFYYSDNSKTGIARVDGSMVYVPFEWAQKLCGMDNPEKRTSAIYIKFKQGIRLEQGRSNVARLWRDFKSSNSDKSRANLLDNVTVQSWKENRRTFIAAMEKEQTLMTVMFGLVGLTTVFIVFVVFYMIISHKSKDIGILKSIGVARADIIGLFCNFAFLVGSIGSIMGVLGGCVFLAYINPIEKWLYQQYGFQMWDRMLFVGIDEIPNAINLKVLLTIIICAVSASLAGAILPSFKAAGLKPVETLQVNQL